MDGLRGTLLVSIMLGLSLEPLIEDIDPLLLFAAAIVIADLPLSGCLARGDMKSALGSTMTFVTGTLTVAGGSMWKPN